MKMKEVKSIINSFPVKIITVIVFLSFCFWLGGLFFRSCLAPGAEDEQIRDNVELIEEVEEREAEVEKAIDRIDSNIELLERGEWEGEFGDYPAPWELRDSSGDSPNLVE